MKQKDILGDGILIQYTSVLLKSKEVKKKRKKEF